MKNIILPLICLFCLKADAQKKASWQIVFEVNGQKSSSPKTEVTSTYYRLVDSASNLFKKYNYLSTTEIITTNKTGSSGGIQFNYPVTKNLKINIGILISSYAIERTKKYTGKITDSSSITLQRTGNGWADPSNGNNYYNGGYLIGSSSGGSGGASGIGSLGGFAYRFYNSYTNPSNKINFTSIDFPVGATYTINNSKFSFNGEISPVFIIRSAIVTNPSNDSEVTYTGGTPNKVNSMVWKFGAGAAYKINDNIEIGLNYKLIISEILLQYEPIKLSTIGMELKFSLPSKKSN
jgi:hypothetical protein